MYGLSSELEGQKGYSDLLSFSQELLFLKNYFVSYFPSQIKTNLFSHKMIIPLGLGPLAVDLPNFKAKTVYGDRGL